MINKMFVVILNVFVKGFSFLFFNVIVRIFEKYINKLFR